MGEMTDDILAEDELLDSLDYFSWRHAKGCDTERGKSACTCGLSRWRNVQDLRAARAADDLDAQAPGNFV